MVNRNKDEQMQHGERPSSSLPTGCQNENFGAAVKPDLTMRSRQNF
jgi:hypothetical protein